MRYSYKDVFDLRDKANELLKEHLSTHKIICVPKYGFVDVKWENLLDKSTVELVVNITRDECYRWLAGFITSMELRTTKSINSKNSWWSKNVRPLFKINH